MTLYSTCVNYSLKTHFVLCNVITLTKKCNMEKSIVTNRLNILSLSPFQQATLERAAREPGYALALKKQQKWSKYGELCRAENIEFSALAVETSGGWEGDAEQIITKISRSLARAIGQEESDMTRHLFGKLSVLLMRSNASMIINRTSIHPLSSTYGGL